MSCFGTRVTPDLYQNCCNANNLCEFDGDMSSVVTAPIYVQQVFDAVKFNLQGMKTFNEQTFQPCLPPGHRIKRVIDIRCKRVFIPDNVDDPRNLSLDVDTGISGATFLKDKQGNFLNVVGADGTYSERIMYAESSDCDDQCKGTPVFGTQCVAISGNIIIELDLLLCDSCNNESCFTVCTEVCIASQSQPMVLTNFFEICMPSSIDTAFLPRFTEFCNSVQLCVLTTGYVDAPLQQNAICTTFPSLFPAAIARPAQEPCEPCEPCKPCCEPCEPCEPCCEPCEPCPPPCDCNPCEPPRRPQPRH